jgi:hypothetical protein
MIKGETIKLVWSMSALITWPAPAETAAGFFLFAEIFIPGTLFVFLEVEVLKPQTKV